MDENNDFEDSNYVMKGESSVSEDNWSGYESNDNDEGFITHSEEEHLVAKLAKGIRGNIYEPPRDGKIVIQIGQVFDDMYHFRRIVKDYVIQNGFEIKRIHNDEIRMTFICVGEGCP